MGGEGGKLADIRITAIGATMLLAMGKDTIMY